MADLMPFVLHPEGGMPRRLRYRSRGFDPVPEQPPAFGIGDLVHTRDGGELGTVEFIRRDGMVCLRWLSGTREWLHQSVLCGPLVP
jgi:uncharacterized protein YodC (DUF2158 family)